MHQLNNVDFCSFISNRFLWRFFKKKHTKTKKNSLIACRPFGFFSKMKDSFAKLYLFYQLQYFLGPWCGSYNCYFYDSYKDSFGIIDKLPANIPNVSSFHNIEPIYFYATYSIELDIRLHGFNDSSRLDAIHFTQKWLRFFFFFN